MRSAFRCYLVVLLLTLSAAASEDVYEDPPTLRADDLAPRGVPLRGPAYLVEEAVPTDGLLATFTIRSPFGTVQARGPGMLRTRVAEVEAIARLSEMKKSDVFLEGLGQSAAAVGGAVANVVTNPVEVAKAIPEGVGRFLDRAGRTAKTAVQKLGDVREGKEPGAPAGAGVSTNQPNIAVAAAAAGGKAVRDILGYEEKRRELASRLNVDPYTTNPILKQHLDEVARAAFAGGLGVDVLAANVPGGRLIRSTSVVNDWIYEKAPADLMVWIEASLRELGVAQGTIDHFLRQRHWTLSTQTALVMALQALPGVAGRVEVLDTAVQAGSEDHARFLVRGIAILARQHESTPIHVLVDGKPVGRTADGRVVAALPVDYVSWTARVASFAARDDLQPHRPLALVTGRLSPIVAGQMQALGWEVRENVSPAGSF